MPSTFYMDTSGAYGGATQYGSWTVTANVARYKLSSTTVNTGLATRTISGDANVALQSHLLGQFWSPPLRGGATLTGSFCFTIRGWESSTSNNMFPAMSVTVRSGDGSTVRGAMWGSFIRRSTEYAITATTRCGTGTTTGSIGIASGDRIVIEIGASGDPATGYGHNVSQMYGCSSTYSDHALTNADAGNKNPWFAFSGDFPLLETPWTKTVSHSVESFFSAAQEKIGNAAATFFRTIFRQPAAAQVGVGYVSSYSFVSTGSVATLTHVTGASDVVVFGAVWDPVVVPANVTLNGTTGTQLILFTTIGRKHALYGWNRPSSGSLALIASFSGELDASGRVGAISFTNTHETNPWGAFGTSYAAGGAEQATIAATTTSGTGGLACFVSVSYNPGDAPEILSGGSMAWVLDPTAFSGAMGFFPSGSNVISGVGYDSAWQQSVGAIPILPSGAVPTPETEPWFSVAKTRTVPRMLAPVFGVANAVSRAGWFGKRVRNAPGVVPTAGDDFDRVDGSLSSPWNQEPGWYIATISNNRLGGEAGDWGRSALHTGLYGSNQWISAIVSGNSAPDNLFVVALESRYATANGTTRRYEVEISGDHYWFRVEHESSNVLLQEAWGGRPKPGDALRFDTITLPSGDVHLNLSINGVSQATALDTTYKWTGVGYPGVRIWQGYFDSILVGESVPAQQTTVIQSKIAELGTFFRTMVSEPVLAFVASKSAWFVRNLVDPSGGGPTSYSNAGGSGDRASSITTSSSAGLWAVGNASNIIDGSQSNYAYFNAVAASGQWIQFDFGTPKVIDEAKWYQDVAQSQGYWKWQGSDNGSDWTDIGANFIVGDPATQTQTELGGNTTAYRYYRLLGVAGSTDAFPYVREIEFKISGAGGGRTTSFIVTKSLGFVRAAVAAITQSQVVRRSASLLRTVANAVSPVSVVKRIGSYLRPLVSRISQSSVVSRVSVLARSVQSAMAPLLSVSRVGSYIRSRAQQIASAFSVRRVGNYLKSIPTNVVNQFSVSRLAGRLRAVAMTIASTSVAARLAIYQRTIALARGATSLVDRALQGTGLFARTIAENLATSHAVSRFGNFARTVGNQISSVFSAVKYRSNILRTAVSARALSDAVSRTGSYLRRASVAVLTSSAVRRVAQYLRAVGSQIAGVISVLAAKGVTYRNAATSLVRSFSVRRVQSWLRNVGNVVLQSTLVARLGYFLRTISTARAAFFSVGRSLGAVARSVAHSIAASAVVSRSQMFWRSARVTVSSILSVSRIAQFLRRVQTALTRASLVSKAKTSVRNAVTSVLGTAPVAYFWYLRKRSAEVLVTPRSILNRLGSVARSAVSSLAQSVVVSRTRGILRNVAAAFSGSLSVNRTASYLRAIELSEVVSNWASRFRPLIARTVSSVASSGFTVTLNARLFAAIYAVKTVITRLMAMYMSSAQSVVSKTTLERVNEMSDDSGQVVTTTTVVKKIEDIR